MSNKQTNKGGLIKRFVSSKVGSMKANSVNGQEVYRDPNWQNPKKENPVKKVVGKLADRVIAGSRILSGK